MTRFVSIGKLTIAVALFGIGLSMVGGLNAQTDLAAVVKERQELMKSMGKSFGPLVAVMKDESTDLVAAAAAAQTMHDGIIKAVTLFPAGTAYGEVPESRAKAEVWTDAADFKAAADALAAETEKLVEAANSGDVDAFKAQFGPTGKACGGCHEGPRDKGGKFRVPKES